MTIPGASYLRLSVTTGCDLRCVYCAPRGASGDGGRALSEGEILRAVEILARRGTRKVRLTGGEPLLRLDLPRLVASLARIPGIEDLALTTNGTRLAVLAHDLAAAGLRRVNVSLDTLDPARFERIAGAGADAARILARIVDGIDAAIGAGLRPVKLNVVGLRGETESEIPALVRFAAERRLELRFIELMPPARASAWPARRLTARALLPAAEVREALASLGSLAPVDASDPLAGPARRYSLASPWGPVLIGTIGPSTEPFCGECNRIRLTADGRLVPCLRGDAWVPLGDLLLRGAPDDEIDARIDRAFAMRDGAPGSMPLAAMSQIGG